MHRALIVATIILGLTALPLAGQVVEGQLILRLKAGFAMDQIKKNNRSALIDIRSQKSLSPDRTIQLLQFDPQDNLEAVRKQLENIEGVEAVQYNRKLKSRSSATPDDPLFNQQWNLERISAPDLWEHTTGGVTPCGDTIVIAVFDSGLDPSHPDVAAHLWRNPGEIANNSFDDDANGYTDDVLGLNLDTGNDRHEIAVDYHGTSVASVIGASTNNSLGIAGLNWQVKLLMISSEEKTEATVMEAFNYVISLRKKYNDSNGEEGAFIVAINNSWGIEGFFEEDFPMLCDMFNALGEVGILGVGATENDQVNTDVFGDIPSDCSSDHLIVVTNTNQDDELAVAGFGRVNVDLGAPGEQIYGADDNESYRTYGGTSYAAPHVSGAIGLLYALSEVPLCDIARVSPTEAAGLVKRFIMEGVTPLPTLDRTVTGGRLNLDKTYDIVTSVADPDPGDLRIYPNPTNAQSVLEFKGPGFLQRIVVKDILGRVMWSANNLKGDHQLTIKAEDWKPGAYVVELLTSNGVLSKILIKN